MNQHDTIILCMLLLTFIIAGSAFWMIMLLEEIRHKQVEMFDRVLHATRAAATSRKRQGQIAVLSDIREILKHE
jgi:hypothetical protein